ncbi:hypothetical protein Dimus_039731 [Dionaea muscipula]
MPQPCPSPHTSQAQDGLTKNPSKRKNQGKIITLTQNSPYGPTMEDPQSSKRLSMSPQNTLQAQTQRKMEQASKITFFFLLLPFSSFLYFFFLPLVNQPAKPQRRTRKCSKEKPRESLQPIKTKQLTYTLLHNLSLH